MYMEIATMKILSLPSQRIHKSMFPIKPTKRIIKKLNGALIPVGRIVQHIPLTVLIHPLKATKQLHIHTITPQAQVVAEQCT